MHININMMNESMQNFLLAAVGFIFLYFLYKNTREQENYGGEITRWKKQLNEDDEKQHIKAFLKKEKTRQELNAEQWKKQEMWQSNRMVDDINILKWIRK